MKQFLLGLLILCSMVVNVDAAILVRSPNGTQITTKPDLATAATSADCAGKTVIVTSVLSAVQSNISSASVHSWPADRILKVEKGGSIGNTTKFVIDSPYTHTPGAFNGTGDVVINGKLTAGPILVSTKLKLGPNIYRVVYPEWWQTNITPGVTDMSQAIQSAIDNVTNGKIVFSPTVYYIGSGLIGHDKLHLAGDGTTITKADVYGIEFAATSTPTVVTSISTGMTSDANLGHTEIVLAMASTTGFNIGDTVQLYGDSAQSFYSNISNISGGNITLDGRLTFTIGTNPKLSVIRSFNSRITGITFNNSVASSKQAITVTSASDIYIDRCAFIGASGSQIQGITYSSAGVVISNSKFDQNGIAIMSYDAGPSVIEKNSITNSGIGIRLVGSHGVNVVSNSVSNGTNQSYGGGIDLQPINGGLDKNCFNTIRGNTVINAAHGIPGSGIGGIHLNFNGNYNVIEGNTSQRNSLGIYLENNNNYNTITGNNTSYNDGYYGTGIQLDWDNKHNTIANNTCNYNIGSTTSAEGIGIEMRGGLSGHDNLHNAITGNTCKFNSVWGITATSTGTVLVGNVVSDNGNDTTQTSHGEIFVHDIKDFVISGNTIHHNTYDARATNLLDSVSLYIQNATEGVITGNNIINETYGITALKLDGSSSTLKIAENVFRNDSVVGSCVALDGTVGTNLAYIEFARNMISSVTNGAPAISAVYITNYSITGNKYSRTTTESISNSTAWP